MKSDYGTEHYHQDSRQGLSPEGNFSRDGAADETYDAKFPDKTLADKLSFVALNETVSRMSYQKKLSSVNEEAKAMLSRTSAYLDNIDKK